MIETLRDYFADDVDYFTDSELTYFIGYERIPMDKLCENETLWKLRSWGKYESYLDAAESIFDDGKHAIFNDKFYKQDPTDQMEQAKEMLQQAGYPIFVTEDYDVWVKRTDWE